MNVFGRPSKRASLLIELGTEPLPDIKASEESLPSSAAELADTGILGSRRWCNYPFLVESIVVGVCDGERAYRQRDGPKSRTERSLSAAEAEQWERESATLASVHRTRWGLDPGAVNVTLDLQLFTGMRAGKGGLGTEKVFDTDVVTVPFQLTLPRPPQVRISDCVHSNLHTNLKSGPHTGRPALRHSGPGCSARGALPAGL
eukprot:COSAG03_NODE_1066_length_4919_cov_34.166183_2_plen_202_part_00